MPELAPVTSATLPASGAPSAPPLLRLALAGACGSAAAGAAVAAGRHGLEGDRDVGLAVGLARHVGRPQNQKSSVAGSPTGHLQVRSVSCIRVRRRAFLAISARFASASALISEAEGLRRRGLARAGLGRTAGIGSLAAGRGAARPRAARGRLAPGSGASSAAGSSGGGSSSGCSPPSAVGEAEAVHLADHRVAGDAAELLGDLAGALAVGPHGLEGLDTFVGPGHFGQCSVGRWLMDPRRPRAAPGGRGHSTPGGGLQARGEIGCEGSFCGAGRRIGRPGRLHSGTRAPISGGKAIGRGSMTLAGRIAWDDTVLPFQLDRADIRGRVGRLDSVLETILGQHDYPRRWRRSSPRPR